jgi:RNA polymerase sigma-70 factor, ECF subfamily
MSGPSSTSPSGAGDPSDGLRAPTSDADLVAAVLAGDRARFGVLVRRHNQRLYRAARAVLGDDAEAEDVVQEAYVRAYRHLAQFRGEASFSTWLVRIAVHEAIARRRARSRLVELAPEEPSMQDERSPEHHAMDAELARLLEREIDALPDGLRAVMVLRDVEEMDTAETAAVLGLSQEAVRVRLHRARRALQGALGETFERVAPATFRVAGVRCDRIAAQVEAALGFALDRA